MRIVILFAAVLIVAGCTTGMKKGAGDIVEADEKIVTDKKCKFVGQVEGHASPQISGKKNRIAEAKREAMKQANKLNAPFIIWDEPKLQKDGAAISGRAYSCE